jgi:hypothetical protein
MISLTAAMKKVLNSYSHIQLQGKLWSRKYKLLVCGCFFTLEILDSLKGPTPSFSISSFHLFYFHKNRTICFNWHLLELAFMPETRSFQPIQRLVIWFSHFSEHPWNHITLAYPHRKASHQIPFSQAESSLRVSILTQVSTGTKLKKIINLHLLEKNTAGTYPYVMWKSEGKRSQWW